MITLKILVVYRRTQTVLQKSDYLKYRTQQISFRFFTCHNLTFYFIYTAVYMALALNGYLGFFNFSTIYNYLYHVAVSLSARYRAWPNNKNPPAPGTPAAAAAATESFNHTHHHHSYSSYASRHELEPIKYRKREPPSLNGIILDLRANCFVGAVPSSTGSMNCAAHSFTVHIPAWIVQRHNRLPPLDKDMIAWLRKILWAELPCPITSPHSL